MITNLADDLSLVDRMKAALAGELERRQQQLRAAGNDVQKIAQYRALRRRRPNLPPMPYLVVVVDEFGELLEARPDVLDGLLSIRRTGRSLSVHLMLAGQRFERGRARGLDGSWRLRICLADTRPRGPCYRPRVAASAADPPAPGHGYLRTGSGLVCDSSGDRLGEPGARARGASRDVRGSRAAGRAPAPSSPAVAQARRTADLAVLVREARAASRRSRAGGRRCGCRRCRGPEQSAPLTLGRRPARLDRVPATCGGAARRHGTPSTCPAGAPRQVPLSLDPGALDRHLSWSVPHAPRTSLAPGGRRRGVRPAALGSACCRSRGRRSAAAGLAPLAALPNVPRGGRSGPRTPSGA